MNNRNTTIAGIGTILAAIGGAMNTWPAVDWATVAAAVLAGLGLIFARDAKGRDA
jgi:hypothetical protein